MHRDHVADLVVPAEMSPRGRFCSCRRFDDCFSMLLTTCSTATRCALERQRIRAGSDVLEALADDAWAARSLSCASPVRRCRRCDLADELCALVLEDVLDLDSARSSRRRS